MTNVDIMVSARSLIATPDLWTQGGLGAKTEHGVPTDNPGSAKCRCLWVAIKTVSPGFQRSSDVAHLMGFGGPSELVDWNDAPERTHADVLARLDAAIAKESADGRV